MTLRRLLPAALGLLPALSFAGSFQLTAQNDSGFSTDRAYTSGVRLSHLWESRVADAPRWELGILQQIFTPDTSRDPAALDERPYAARLLLYGARHAAGPGRLDTLEVSAGVTGPSALGRQAQDLFHRFVSSPEPDWRRQLHDRFDGNAGATFTRTLARSASHPVSLAGHAGGSVGTVLGYVHGALEARWGAEQAPWSEALRLAASPVTDAGRGGGLSAFAGASVRQVFRSELLERNGDDPGRRLDREDTVVRYAAGAGYAAAWGTVTFALAQESREYASQPYRHRFWSLGLAIALD